MLKLVVLAILFELAQIGTLCAGGVSGTYVGKGSNSVFMIQMVEGADRSITGRYVKALLPASGPPQQSNSSVTGTYDGHTIVLTIKPAELLAGSMTVSGSVDQSSLHLTGGGYGSSLTLNLLKSDEAEFQAAAAKLSEQAQQIASAKAISDFRNRTNELIPKFEKYSAQVENTKEKLAAASVEQRYQRTTELMRAAHDRQRSILGDGQQLVARGQIDVAINQAANQSIQLHQQVISEWQSVYANGNTLANESRATIEKCKSIAASDVEKEAGAPEIKATCAKLLAIAALVGPNTEGLRQAFAKTEKVWVEEERKQREIVRAADYAVR